ncbi:MAG: helix-turn-helix transcriptional regulator, partial [Pseudomonadota bacterium]|nr:helix-turn-helix transcriptional regulator [Pseudomonadota bacterium]
MRTLGQKSDAQGSASNDGAKAMTVGRYLKSQREERGEDVTQVANMLRIHRSYLQAIEDSDIEKLPGPTYAIGFVRAYAEHLGLDGAQVTERFKEEGKVQASRTPLVLPSPLPEGRIPSGAIL